MSRKDHKAQAKRQQNEYERIKHANELITTDPAIRDAAVKALGNPISRSLLKLRSHNSIVAELEAGSTTDQIVRLDTLVGIGSISERKMKESLMRKAPAEMDKAIRLFQKQKKEITVDSLCAEAESTPEFVRMCEKVGLPMSWFRELAQQRMDANKV